jgi:hypothetical protein
MNPLMTDPSYETTRSTQQLRLLQDLLPRVSAGEARVQALSDMARQSDALLDALPARYREVLLALLDRLESSALFSEESCSFSQRDLLDSVQAWMDKAAAQLPPP